jgi:predicted nucleic acid-binding protein
MGAIVVLDAGVLIGLWDPDDGHHEASVLAVRALRDSRARLVVPATVLAEVLVGAARQGEARLRMRADQVRAAFGAPLPVDARVAMAAARLRVAHPGIRISDAMVIASAHLAGAAEILTVEPSLGEVDTRVRVIG